MGSGQLLPTLPSLLTEPHLPFIHRDLSWLQFNERVLSEAQQKNNPLLERLKFLAISASNMDEFFMIRYASLVHTIQSASRSNPRLALRLVRIRNNILEAVHKFEMKQDRILCHLSSELEQAQIHLTRFPSPVSKEIFDQKIFPMLSPPEPFSAAKLSSLENFQIGMIFSYSIWLKIPKSLPSVHTRWDPSAKKLFVFFLDDLLTHHLGTSLRIQGQPVLVRLTRDGDFTVDIDEEDTESIPDIVRNGLRIREKGRPVRLQIRGKPHKNFLNQAMKSLKLSSSQIVFVPSTLCLRGSSSIHHDLPEFLASEPTLSYPPFLSIIPKPFKDPRKIFEKLNHHDLLLHHPYDSFDAFVSWIQAACADPDVIQIEQTVYRMDALSPIIDALKSAASVKKVRVVIELRARFDELNNLRLAEELRNAGVEVAFGFGRLKLHGKVALVSRKMNGRIKLYAHLSTGNYNATTARQYTDLAILTSDPQICSDVQYFFDQVFKGEIPKDFKYLVSAPTKLHRKLLSYIQGEIDAAKHGLKARIFAKVNALVDHTVIQHLYEASRAGVHVDLIVRGACSLIPGVKGLSENIRVISIIDRFLEHSRIYYFQNAKRIYLSSADWMPRNFFSRLELAFPILDPDIYNYIEKFVIPVYLSDTIKARELTPEGKWKRPRSSTIKNEVSLSRLISAGEKLIRSQVLLQSMAAQNYEGTPLWKRGSLNEFK